MSTAPKKTAAPLPADTPAGPTSGVRTTISFLIFVHFFFLLVSIKSSTDSSGLELDIAQRVPGLRQYSQLLAMDLAYMFNFTYYMPLGDSDDASLIDPNSTDLVLEYALPQADGWSPYTQWKFDGPGVRRRRLERLVNFAIPGNPEHEDGASLALQGIAARLMAEHQCTSLKLRIRCRELQDWLGYQPGDENYAEETARSPRDPIYLRTLHEVSAVLSADPQTGAGRVELVPVQRASQTAPPAPPTTGVAP